MTVNSRSNSPPPYVDIYDKFYNMRKEIAKIKKQK